METGRSRGQKKKREGETTENPLGADKQNSGPGSLVIYDRNVLSKPCLYLHAGTQVNATSILCPKAQVPKVMPLICKERNKKLKLSSWREAGGGGILVQCKIADEKTRTWSATLWRDQPLCPCWSSGEVGLLLGWALHLHCLNKLLEKPFRVSCSVLHGNGSSGRIIAPPPQRICSICTPCVNDPFMGLIEPSFITLLGSKTTHRARALFQEQF